MKSVADVGSSCLIMIMLLFVSACGGHNSSSPTTNNSITGPGVVVVPKGSNSFIGPYTIYLQRDIDLASLKPDSVTLVDLNFQKSVPVTCQYDSTARRITFTPQSMLWEGRAYSVNVTGLRALDGELLGDTKYKLFMSDRRIDTLVDSKPDNITGRYTEQHVLDEKRTVRIQYCSQEGVDGVWGTAEDVLAQYEDRYFQKTAGAGFSNYPDIGFEKTRMQITGSGHDGIWFTEDDTVSSYIINLYDDRTSRHQTNYYSDSGKDGLWLSSDDVLGSYWRRGQEDKRYISANYTAVGGDHTWFTADDVPDGYMETDYDASGNLLRDSNIVGAGIDGVWFTADDIPV